MPEPRIYGLPRWASLSIRRAAFRACLGWVLPIAAALVLLAGIGALLYFGEAESPWIPIFWLTVFGVVLLVFFWEFLARLKVLISPGSSPEIGYLRGCGPLAQVLAEVRAELDSPARLRFGREITLTARWLVISGGERFAVRRLDDLVWAFPKVEEVRLAQNIYITIRRIPYAEFRCARGEDCRARASEAETAALLEVLAQRCPGIVLGRSEELERAWRRDKAGFVAAVRATRNAP